MNNKIFVVGGKYDDEILVSMTRKTDENGDELEESKKRKIEVLKYRTEVTSSSLIFNIELETWATGPNLMEHRHSFGITSCDQLL